KKKSPQPGGTEKEVKTKGPATRPADVFSAATPAMGLPASCSRRFRKQRSHVDDHCPRPFGNRIRKSDSGAGNHRPCGSNEWQFQSGRRRPERATIHHYSPHSNSKHARSPTADRIGPRRRTAETAPNKSAATCNRRGLRRASQ